MTPEHAALCERLKARVPGWAFDRAVNPDGQAAAAAIERLSAKNEALTDTVLDAAAAYLIDTYGMSYGLDNEIDRARIKATFKGADQ